MRWRPGRLNYLGRLKLSLLSKWCDAVWFCNMSNVPREGYPHYNFRWGITSTVAIFSRSWKYLDFPVNPKQQGWLWAPGLQERTQEEDRSKYKQCCHPSCHIPELHAWCRTTIAFISLKEPAQYGRQLQNREFKPQITRSAGQEGSKLTGTANAPGQLAGKSYCCLFVLLFVLFSLGSVLTSVDICSELQTRERGQKSIFKWTRGSVGT